MAHIQSFDDRDGFIWMNGEMLDWRASKIHVLNHGLHYASSVFEGERAYNGTIFKSKEHSERFLKSAEIIDMKIPYTVEELMEAKQAVMEANNLKDCYVRPVAWRGSENMKVGAPDTKTNVAIACWGWGAYFDKDKYEQGIKIKTSAWRAPPPECAPVQSKCAGVYTTHTAAKHIAEREGYDDALMLDYRGYVAEATAANLFLIKDGALFTPIADCFLNGITRQTVIALARDLGYEVHETRIKPEEISSFEQAFLTGTAAEIVALGQIDDHKLPVGDIVRAVRSAYANLVREKN